LIVFTSCGTDSDKTNTTEVTFGVLYPETGSLAFPGLSSKAAMDLAVQDINNYFQSKNKAIRINLSYKDTAGDSALALVKIKEFYNQGIRVIIGPYTSEEASAVREYANLNDMILLGWGSTAPSLAISNDNLMRFIPTDVLQAAAIAQKMYEKGVTAVVGLNRNDVWGNDFINQMKSALPNYNITYIDGISYNPSTTDFSATVSSLNSKITTTRDYYESDSIAVMLISYDEAGKIFTAANAYSVLQNTKWFGCDGNYNFIDFTTYPVAGTFAVNPKVSFLASCYLTAYNAGDTPSVSAFLPSPTTLNSRISAITGTSTGNDYYMIAYDMLWIASLAYDQTASGATISSLKQNIVNVASDTYVGVNGQIVFNSSGDRTTGGYGYFGVRQNGANYEWFMDSVYKKYSINKAASASYATYQSTSQDNSDSIILIEVGSISNVMTSEEYTYWWYYWWWDLIYLSGNYEEENYYNMYLRYKLNIPQSVTLDDTGNIYVTDVGLSRVIKFDGDGFKLAEWGSFGNGYDTNLIYPAGLSTGNNFCYVSDRDSHTIKKYDLYGNFIAKFGVFDNNVPTVGKFNKPGKMFYDRFANNLFVIDSFNNRLQYMDNGGTWRAAFANSSEPVGFAATNNNYYLLTRGDYKITKFNKTDTTVSTSFGSYGLGLGKFLYPVDLTVSNDSIIVLDNYSIHAFDNAGTPKLRWNSYGKLRNPTSITSDTAGYVYVTDAGKNCVNIYRIYNSQDILVKSLNNGAAPDSWPYRIAVDNVNNLVYVATWSHWHDIEDNCMIKECVLQLDANLNVLKIWGSELNNDRETVNSLGNFSSIESIIVDKDGNVFVSDQSNYRIQKLAAGSNTWTLFVDGSTDNLRGLKGLASDSQGNIYAIDKYSNKILKYSAAGTLLSETLLDSLDEHGFNYLSVANNGNIYLLNTSYCNIAVFNSNMQFVTQWGDYGFENGKFLWPTDIKTDANNNVYVVDSDNSRISKFDSTGKFIKKWGTYGYDKLQFSYPYGIAVDNDWIWVADSDNARIQKFRQ
ncbi:ABC transporter substrate-binding protein, partial [Candidatus Dependentiae bacterium]|nr:ABC transporter substrate-binding protein [Candidatus Dependentiae bacterium]